MAHLDAQSGLAALKAAAEATRLRILFLLARSELTVKDLTRVLGQSQPRISRHLKLMHEAGLIERHREGSWVYFRLAGHGGETSLAERIIAAFDINDSTFRRDAERLGALATERAVAAQGYFERIAADWDRLRSLYIDEGEVETAMRLALGDEHIGVFVDLGTGTGRMLELFADRYERGLGIDVNKAMLSYARAKLEQVEHGGVQVRQGDLYNLALEEGTADVVVMHQVLHHLNEPAAAIVEAARILAPGGRLVVVDFAPHDLDFLREEFAHARLGFADDQVRKWFADAGLHHAEHKTFAPPDDRGDEQLTVSLWVASRTKTTTAQAAPTADPPTDRDGGGRSLEVA